MPYETVCAFEVAPSLPAVRSRAPRSVPITWTRCRGKEELAPGAPVWQPGCTLAPTYPLYTWGKTVPLPIHNSTSGSRPEGQCQGTHWRPDLAVEAAAVGTALRGQSADWCPLETDRAGRKVRTALGKQEKPLPSLAQSDWGSCFTAGRVFSECSASVCIPRISSQRPLIFSLPTHAAFSGSTTSQQTY